MTPDETKAALKEALKEWMDDNFAIFGRWSFYSLFTMVAGGLIYLFLATRGWKV